MSRHVILIDDDKDDAEIFSDALDQLEAEFSLSHYDNGFTALHVLQQNLDVPADIIFMDINMPKIDGWKCLRELKNIASLKNIPVVMYSTSNLAAETFSPGDVGAAAFLTKPDNFQELKAKLQAVFATVLPPKY